MRSEFLFFSAPCDYLDQGVNVPDGLVILFLRRTQLEEPVLANVDSALHSDNFNDRITHLGDDSWDIPLVCGFIHTLVTQLFITFGMSIPLASATPDQRSLVTLFP